MRARAIRWAISGGDARKGLLLALIVPVALYLGFVAYPAGAGDSARAVLFVSGLIAVATMTSLPAALACAVVSALAYEMSAAPGALFEWTPADAFLPLAFVAIAVIVARRASRTRQEVEAIRVGATTEHARRELTELLSTQPSERAIGRTAVEFLEDRLGMPAALWVGGRGYVREGAAPPIAGAISAGSGVATSEDGWTWVGFGENGAEGAVGLRAPPGRPPGHATIGLVRGLCADIGHMVLRSRLASDLQKERAANESERLCTALLASVAHDLRTPLSTILMSSETLRRYSDTLPPPDKDSLLESIELEGRRLDGYIQHLVDVTQIGKGAMDMELDRVGADEVIGAAVTRLRRFHRDARVDVHVDPALPPLRVHAPLLEQAIYNLLDNAAKFSPEDAPISIAATRGESGEILLDVVDEGPGIPRADRERVFDMFYSEDRSGGNRAGTGLGLAISQSIVRAHGGEVRVDHPPTGRGTLMRIALPPRAAAEVSP